MKKGKPNVRAPTAHMVRTRCNSGSIHEPEDDRRCHVLSGGSARDNHDELHVEVKRFPRPIEAYWNGSAWLV